MDDGFQRFEVSSGPRMEGEVTRTVTAGAVATTIDEFRAASIAPNTLRAYTSDLRQFRRRLAGYRRTDDPKKDDAALLARNQTLGVSVDDVEHYLRELANDREGERYFYSPATIARAVAAINWEHDQHAMLSPGRDVRVRTLLAGIKRTRHRPEEKAAPMMIDMLQKVVLQIDISSPARGAMGVRDAAVLVLGMIGAFRRSELPSLNIGDFRFDQESGVTMRLRTSKTDQEGHGFAKAAPFRPNSATCGPCAYIRWYRLLVAQRDGRAAVFRALRDNSWAVHVCREPHPFHLNRTLPFFRAFTSGGEIKDTRISGGAIGLIVKRRALAAGLDVDHISGHSLRAGFITQASVDGATTEEIMRQTGQSDPRTVDGYRRFYTPLLGNAVMKLRS